MLSGSVAAKFLAMEFWGIEVPAGKPTLCSPGGDVYLHMTQAALGESKSGSGNDRVVIRVKVGDIEVVLGTLSQGKCDQMAMDLIFDTDFSIFHNGSSSIYLSGYKTEASGEEYPSDEDDSEEDEELEPAPSAVALKTNGDVPGGKNAVSAAKTDVVITQEAAVEAGKIAAAQAKKKLEKHVKTPVVAEVDEDDEEDEDDDDDESDDEMATPGEASPFFKDVGSESDEDDESFDGDMEDDDSEEISDDEEDDDEDESDDEDEMQFEVETPTPKSGKKRAASTTPKIAEKKVRMDTPAKPGLGSNGDKKIKATPATPVAPVAKTPEKEQKTPKDKKGQPKTPTMEKAQTPKGTPVSGKKLGDHKCTACDKNFATEIALTQHSAAKHKVKT